MAYLMGIDLGTSSLKTIIIDENGTVMAQSARAYQFASPHGGYAEHDPGEWWQACCETVRDTLVTLWKTGIRSKGCQLFGTDARSRAFGQGLPGDPSGHSAL